MQNGGKIITGLVILVGVMTYPFYTNIGKKVPKIEPSLDTPVIQQMDKKECIRPKEIMRAEHMKILDEWRDEVVRDNKRDTFILGGVEFEKSLQNGCMKCHSNKREFCDRCHSYAGVKPYCWGCHFVKEEAM